MMPAVVIGGVNVDMLAVPAAPLVPGVSNPGRVRIGAGGAGRNVAENLARLGVATRLIASADAHPLTDLAITQTAQAGVDTSGILRVPGRGNYYVAIEDAGAVRWAVSDMPAAETLTPGDLDARASFLREAAVVVVDANLQPATITRAAELAARGHLCLLPVSPAKAPKVRAVLAHAALLVLGIPEAEVLSGTKIRTPQEALRAAQQLRPAPEASVVLTMGDRGVAWVMGGQALWADPVPGLVVDPTGAGDAVAAVALHAVITSLDPRRAARLAMVAAAMTVGVEGANHPGLSLDALHARI
ncbi:MAG TPA: PfkB family carbohydrate kinase [bacterium]|nr:PfkB family carbohydrate kinase [bacterium]